MLNSDNTTANRTVQATATAIQLSGQGVAHEGDSVCSPKSTEDKLDVLKDLKDTVTILKQSPPDWAYVDYVNGSGTHLLRWITADQLTIKQ
jgi:hypothetical protein